jgi:TP901 family phage tail tape measure protein
MTAAPVEYIIELRDAYSAIAEKVARATKALNEVMASLGKSTIGTEEALARFKVPPGLSALTRETESATKAMVGLGEATAKFARLSPPTLGASHILGQRKAEAEAAARDIEVASRRARAASRGGGLPGGLGAGLGFMALAGVGRNNVFSDWLSFDEEMRKTRGTLAGQASDADMEMLRKSAMSISRGSRFSPEDIAKLFATQASTGIPVEMMPQVARQMMGIATGTGEDMGSTFQTHLAIQRGFELPLTAFPHISDTIARVHQKTGISLAQIHTQMGQIAEPAGKAGWTEEETAATLGYLSKRGMGQYAGSGLQRILSRSLHWSKPAAAAWEDLGIKQEDLIDKKTGGLVHAGDLVDLLNTHTKGKRMADVYKDFSVMFGDRGVKIADALTGHDSTELRALTDDLQTISGLAEKMGVEGSKGGAAGVAALSASLKGLHDAIGESGFGDQVGSLARGLAGLLDSVSTGPTWLKEGVGWAAALTNALSGSAMQIGVLLFAFPQLRAAIAGVAEAAAGLVATFAKIAGPLGALAYLYSQHTPEAAKREFDTMGKEGAGNRAIMDGFKNWLSGNGYVQSPAPGAQSSGGGYIGGFSDAAKNLMNSGAQRIIVESQIKVPDSIRIQVDATGPNGTRGSSSADLPITAAPRGEHQDAPGAWQRDN